MAKVTFSSPRSWGGQPKEWNVVMTAPDVGLFYYKVMLSVKRRRRERCRVFGGAAAGESVMYITSHTLLV